MATIFPLQEYINTCCDCEGTMQMVEGTIKEFIGANENNSYIGEITIATGGHLYLVNCSETMSWWECLLCGRKEKIVWHYTNQSIYQK
jgi:hypothetical protein